VFPCTRRWTSDRERPLKFPLCRRKVFGGVEGTVFFRGFEIGPGALSLSAGVSSWRAARVSAKSNAQDERERWTLDFSDHLFSSLPFI